MNRTCEKCGGKCCKTLVYPTANMPGALRELLATRAVKVSPDRIWINAPCKYLVGGVCSIYESRPAACSAYPVHGADCQAARDLDIYECHCKICEAKRRKENQ